MQFKTCDILSCSTGILMGKMDGVYKVAEFLVGAPVWTHQLVEIAPVMRAFFAERFDNIPGRDAISEDTPWDFVLSECEDRVGKTFDIPEKFRGVLGCG